MPKQTGFNLARGTADFLGQFRRPTGLAQPGASQTSEIRRLLPEIRGIVGDDRRVLVGFDRGGWSPALFAGLTKAGFDVPTWRKGAITDLDAALSARTPTPTSAAPPAPFSWPRPPWRSRWTSTTPTPAQ